MATLSIKPIVSVIDDYTKGRGWFWNEVDCIGLMFSVVNDNCNTCFDRASYIPPELSYKEAMSWLSASYTDPLTPYTKFLGIDAGLHLCYNSAGCQIILLYGGDDIVDADGERYSIDKVPGVAFKTIEGAHYVLMRSGMKSVNIKSDNQRTMIRYKLGGLR